MKNNDPILIELSDGSHLRLVWDPWYHYYARTVMYDYKKPETTCDPVKGVNAIANAVAKYANKCNRHYGLEFENFFLSIRVYNFGNDF